jgi:hypothetical protein
MRQRIDWKHFQGSHWTYMGEGLRHFTGTSLSKKRSIAYMRSDLTGEIRIVPLSEIQDSELWKPNWILALHLSENKVSF